MLRFQYREEDQFILFGFCLVSYDWLVRYITFSTTFECEEETCVPSSKGTLWSITILGLDLGAWSLNSNGRLSRGEDLYLPFHARHEARYDFSIKGKAVSRMIWI